MEKGRGAREAEDKRKGKEEEKVKETEIKRSEKGRNRTEEAGTGKRGEKIKEIRKEEE